MTKTKMPGWVPFWIGAVAIAIGVVLVANWWSILAWLAAFEKLSGWAQTFGSLLAIAVTYLLASSSAREAREARHAEQSRAFDMLWSTVTNFTGFAEGALQAVDDNERMRAVADEASRGDRLVTARKLAEMDMAKWPSLEVYEGFREWLDKAARFQFTLWNWGPSRLDPGQWVEWRELFVGRAQDLSAARKDLQSAGKHVGWNDPK